METIIVDKKMLRKVLESTVREYAILAIGARSEEPHTSNLEYLNNLILEMDTDEENNH